MQKINLQTPRMANAKVDPHCEGFQTNLLFGLDELCEKFIDKNSTILEIGCYNGISTSLLCYYAKEVDAVDIKISKKLSDLRNQVDNLTLHEQHSLNYFKEAISRNKKYDLIYLDGDHSYNAVKNEILLARQILKPNGILSGHDMVEGNKRLNNGVLKAVYEVYPEIEKGDIRLYRFSDSSWAIKHL